MQFSLSCCIFNENTAGSYRHLIRPLCKRKLNVVKVFIFWPVLLMSKQPSRISTKSVRSDFHITQIICVNKLLQIFTDIRLVVVCATKAKATRFHSETSFD